MLNDIVKKSYILFFGTILTSNNYLKFENNTPDYILQFFIINNNKEEAIDNIKDYLESFSLPSKIDHALREKCKKFLVDELIKSEDARSNTVPAKMIKVPDASKYAKNTNKYLVVL